MRRTASKISSLPLLSTFSPAVNRSMKTPELQGFLDCQQLALGAAAEIAAQMQPGWTERQAADLLGTYLRDLGVRSYFHAPFAWFGERAAFRGFRRYRDFLPSNRALQENEVFILDVAPIFHGFVADIGYTACLGKNDAYRKAMTFLSTLRQEIPGMFTAGNTGAQIWQIIDDKIRAAGYENAHQKYPFGVVGHRVHQGVPHLPQWNLMRFGWQSAWTLLSRGLFGQLLNKHHEGDLIGLWAIEPHLATAEFGAKFEEILVVEKNEAYWLERSH